MFLLVLFFLLVRSFEHIFETTAASSNIKYLVHASFLEIYNEELRDLLDKDSKVKCELKEHPEKGVFVTGLSIHKVKCVEDCKVCCGSIIRFSNVFN